MAKKQVVPDFQYHKYKLKNGLDVILLEDHRLPLVAVNIWYHVGPVNERPGLTGFAHLFEHMMFEGSKHVGEKGHFLYLEAAGASTINGSTDFDRTNYFETLPSNQLELALWLESDRMGFLLDQIDLRKLENQCDVVRNERRQVIENAPYGLVQEELFHQIFPKDHPYYSSIMGSHADIESAQIEDVRNFFRLYYAPNNASLAIVGDIEPDKTRELVEKYFGPLPAGSPVPSPSKTTPPIASERRAVVGDQVELPRVYLAWITDPIFTQGDAECDLIARILGGGKSSRLYESLVYEKRIAQDVSAHQASLALGSVFVIDATGKPGVEPQQLEDAIRNELEKFQKDGPTQAELDRARNTIESSIIRALENLGGFADRLNLYNHFLGDPGFLPRDMERYAKAGVASLKNLARKQFKRESGVVVWGIPGQKVVNDVPKSAHSSGEAVLEKIEIAGQDWRKSLPLPGPPPAINLPIPKKFNLGNGFTVFLVEEHSLPIVSANVITLCGSDQNLPSHPGHASFTAEMLDEGTGKRSSLKIAADADQIGATLTTGSSADYAFVAARTLKKNADAAFELAADILLNPAFEQEEIERIRHDRLTHILQQKDSPNVLSIKVFFEAVYGSSHPYGHMDIGTEESNKAIARDHLLSFYQKGYFPSNSALVVAGDMTESELGEVAEKYFGGWKGTGCIGQAPAVTDRTARRILIVEKPEAPQTVLRIGHVGAPQSSPDYVALDVMNTVLGGLFSSRINLNLREQHGYTYGASSSFVFRRGAGPFLIGTSVRTDVTAAAVTEIFREIERMRDSEVTPEELATAKDSMARSLPGLFETTPESASSIGQLFVHGLPLHYYHKLPDQIQNISAAEVRRVAQNYLRPEDMVIVAVGDRGKIEPELRKLNLGPIEIRDSAGNS
ncbi:MAG: insulinase family protein [Acidobacteria bacterium]|nr:insulinase family protein [Acidobacteriota bacterium]